MLDRVCQPQKEALGMVYIGRRRTMPATQRVLDKVLRADLFVRRLNLN